MTGLSHVDPQKGPGMVDVGGKAPTQREAVARGRVAMSSETLKAVLESRTPKGDVLSTARIAGIMAAKRTPELIPLCHPLPLSFVGVELTPNEAESSIEIEATVRTTASTGVEMEALTAVSVAALTIYDMCKSLEKAIRIQDVRLARKTGGKSGPVLLEE